MLALNAVSNEEWGESVYKVLTPGAALLAKWLPVFFVPSMITLPLASGLGNVWEVRVLSCSGLVRTLVFVHSLLQSFQLHVLIFPSLVQTGTETILSYYWWVSIHTFHHCMVSPWCTKINGWR